MSYAGDISPQEAFRRLSDEPTATLVDVRTPAEWTQVGLPDLGGIGKPVVTASWHPELTPEQLAATLKEAGVDESHQLLFLCRSGQRSRFAAELAAAAGFNAAYNVEHGFEGPPNQHGRRSAVAGWKFDGLPWGQS